MTTLVAPVMRVAHMVLRWYWRLLRPTTRGSRVLILDGDKVLLVRHTYDPRWYLPGGGTRRGETFEDAARREVYEEMGLTVRRLNLFSTYVSRQEGKKDQIAIFAACAYEGRPRVQSREIADVAFHMLNRLPHDVSPATHRRIVEYMGGAISDTW